MEITITKAEYDSLCEKSLILDIVERTVRNDSDSVFGYSSNTRVILEAVLGISRNKEKNRLRYCSTQSAKGKEQ